ncbi:MAG TPA: hypothetical protein PK264_11505, partial [Hyphomicrobiaceae bacterium]|nr:hypothetical protein [Hyphomicrobiaceae bacterium]
GTLGMDEVIAELAPRLAAPRSAAAAAAKPADGLAGLDIVVRLNAGRVSIADRKFRNVVADISREAGRLRIGTLRLATDDGIAIEMQGDVAGLATLAAWTGLT